MTPDRDSFDPFERALYFIRKREDARLEHDAGGPPPHSDDPIIAENRFCNVHRNADRGTRELMAEWIAPHLDDPDVWFAAVVARCCINWTPTLRELGYPVPFDPDHYTGTLAARKVRREIVFGAAYVLPAGASGLPKAEHQAEEVLAPIWARREELRPRPGQLLQIYYNRLTSCQGIGSFLAGQVIADLKQIAPLKDASDWFDFCVSGPGSRRGLNRLLGRPVDAHWAEHDWRRECLRARNKLAPDLDRLGIGRLCAQDFQNISCCEWDKFERVRLGEGRMKRRYLPKGRGAPAVGRRTAIR